ncbi:aquaporin AQPcic isoform X2 [Halyomorpha halys]|uniref:aquaporin AQPcic isoform X2 n=1 Tax=Halyomorpha halys TaxID=286706 RepID=UPI0006D51AE8
MSRSKADEVDATEKRNDESPQFGYKSLLKDDGFSDLNVLKVRRLVGIGVAEMLGTAVFMAMGCGSVVTTITGGEISHLNTVISFAFGIATSIIIFGPVSGAVMNPALNLTAVILGHMSLQKCLFYTIFQLFGGFLGVSFIRMVTPDIDAEGFCVTQPAYNVSISSAFMVEFMGTAVLAWGLCNALDPRMKEHGAIVGFKFLVIITSIGVPGGKYAGGSLNPARSFGPALAAGNWDNHWIYWSATCLGASFAAIIYRVFFDREIYEVDQKKEESNPI